MRRGWSCRRGQEAAAVFSFRQEEYRSMRGLSNGENLI